MPGRSEQPGSETGFAMPFPLVAGVLLGGLLALGGGYVDDAWHTERGRDQFLIPPHVAIYAGVSLAGAALVVWLLLSARRHGLRQALRYRPLQVGLLGVAVTLAAGPIDNAWHLAFGRDAVIWSPPHVLGIVGTAALATAILVESSHWSGAWGRALEALAGGFVLAPFVFLVIEYETDVPQFPSLWYLPVLAMVSALALSIVRLGLGRAWAATQAAVTQLAFVAVVGIVMLVMGFDPPRLPWLIVPAVVLDLSARRGLPAWVQGLPFAVALYGVYVPALDWLGEGVHLDAADVALGLPLAALASALVLMLVGGSGRRAPLTAAVGWLVAGLWLAVATPVEAHDPGQGHPAGTAGLSVRTHGRSIAATAALRQPGCRQWRGLDLVARRGGQTITRRLRQTGCRFSGRLTVTERGRWFVYVEALRPDGRVIESWLPVKVDGDSAAADPTRYAYISERRSSSAVEMITGGALYLAMLAVLATVVRLVRREAAMRPVTEP